MTKKEKDFIRNLMGVSCSKILVSLNRDCANKNETAFITSTGYTFDEAVDIVRKYLRELQK